MYAAEIVPEFLIPLILTAVILILFYKYSIHHHDYWKRQGVPYIRPMPFLGSILQNMMSPLQDLDLKRHMEIGPIYGHFEGNKPILTVADPKLLRQIMIKDFHCFSSKRIFATGDKIVDKMLSFTHGEDWKRVRNIVSRAFSTGKIKRVFRIFKECSVVLVENLKRASENGKYLNVKSFYGGFTLDNIASSAFSTKLNSHKDPNNQFVKTARCLFANRISWRFVMFLVCPRLMRLLKISLFDPSIVMFFENLTLDIVKQRKETGTKQDDFLQFLLEAVEENVDRDDTEIEAANLAENKILESKNLSSSYMSMDELVSMCVSFFLGGYNTTVTTLSMATYLLALHPQIQAEAREEIHPVLNDTDGVLTYETLQEMHLLDNIIYETLRLYPTGFRLDRVADVDYKLGDTGIIIPKGILVVIPIYALQRDPKIYHDPDQFDPNRFSINGKSERDSLAYLPFGAGPRYCIGMRFALLEIKVCLAHILHNFQISTCPKTMIPLEFVRQGFSGQKILHPKDIYLKMDFIQGTSQMK